MKYIVHGLLVLGLLAIQVSEANAAACAAGPYRAGCVGPRGAVGVHRGYGYGYHGGYGYRPYGYGGAAAVGAAAVGAAAVGAAVAAPRCWINNYGQRVCN